MQRIFLLMFSILILFLLFLPDVDAQTGIYPAPILVEPTNGQKLGREAVTFKWAWEGELAGDEYFCAEVWKLQMEPTSAPLRLTRSTSLSVPAIDLSSGDYQWKVTVVRVANFLPEEELSEPSEAWSFSWGQAIPSPRRSGETQPSWASETTARILAWITGNITRILAWITGNITRILAWITGNITSAWATITGNMSSTLTWVKENIVGILVYATVSWTSITAVVLLSVYLFVAEPNQMPFPAALRLIFNPKELVFASTSQGNYLNERWKDWEQIIDEEIDNVLLEEVYKAPPYGLYVELPIVVRGDSLDRIPKTFRRYALHRYYDEHREEDSFIYIPPEEKHGYGSLQLPSITDIADSWKSMIAYVDGSDDRKRSRFRDLTASFILSLAQTLRSVKVEETVYSHDYMHGYLLRMPTPRIKIPRSVPVVFLQKTYFTEEDIAKIVDFVRNFGTEHFLAILITCDPPKYEGTSAHQLQRLINGSPYAEDFIILHLIDILHVLRAENKSDRFVQTIVSRRSLSAVSPYVIAGPVPKDMFFGRDKEIRLIVEGAARNCAIVGGRKIGKTSTLQEVHRRLERDSRYSTFYLDCQAIRTYQDFFNAVGKKVERSFEDDPTNFHSVVSLLRRESAHGLIIFMMDEIDDILDYDAENGEPLFRTFRTLSHEGDCCFVFCGSKTLYQRIHHPESPFFNFCTNIPLGELDKESAEEIIIRPMSSMNVQLDEGVVKEIIRISSRHPNFVQYICHTLIEHIASHRSRHITLEDLELITTGRDFCEYFVKTAWGEATPLEKLITLLMLDRPNFAKDDVYIALERHGLRDRRAVDQALETLEVYYFLIKGPRLYHFAWSEFPHIVRKVQNVGELQRSLLWQMTKQ